MILKFKIEEIKINSTCLQTGIIIVIVVLITYIALPTEPDYTIKLLQEVWQEYHQGQ